MNLFIFLLFFVYIFGPVFNSIGPWFDTIILFSAFYSFFYLFKFKWHYPGYFKHFLILILLFIIVASLSSIYEEITLFSFFGILLRPFRILFTLLAGYFLVLRTYKKNKTNYTQIVVELVFYSILFHAIIMALQMHNPAFKDFIYSYTTTGEYRSTFEYNFRMGGLTGTSGGAILSIIQSFGVILTPFLIKYNTSKINKLFFLMSSLLILYSVLICGRSGIWNILIFLPIAVMLNDKKNGIKKVLYLFLTCFFLILCFYFISNLLPELEDSSPLFYSFNRTLDTFLKVSQGQGFEDRTIEVLKSHILIPNDLRTLLIGNPEHLVKTGFKRTLNSDIGYIRNLWSFGIFGTIVFLLPAYRYLIKSFKSIKYSNSAKLLFIVSASMFLFHAKEGLMYTRMLLSIYSIFLALFYFEYKLAKNQN